MTRTIGILAAMEKEAVTFGPAISISPDKDVEVIVTGIGKVNAAVSATEFILRKSPCCIINIGCTGAMLESIVPGDVIVAEKLAYHDVWCGDGNAPGQIQGEPLYFSSEGALVATAMNTATPLTVHKGLECSSDQFFISMEEDGRIRRAFPGVMGCDMESAAIAQTCRRFGIPFLCIRLVSDTHVSETAQKESYSRFWEGSFDAYREYLKNIISQI